MRFYISGYEVLDKYKNGRAIEVVQDTFFSDLTAKGIDYYNGSSFTSYENIFKEIRQSDIVVVIADIYWASATWKYVELGYALGIEKHTCKDFIDTPKQCYIHDTSIKTMLSSYVGQPNTHTFDGTLDDLLVQLQGHNT